MTEQNKRIALIIAIIASLTPSVFLISVPGLISLKSLALYASSIIGYMGIVLLLWMYILGTKAVTGLIFRDLAAVLKIHKWLGKYGALAVFLHPILITYTYGESWLFSVIPRVGTVAERHILLGQIAFWILVLTWVVSAYLRKRMAFRPWKYLHYLAYVCVPFALLHVPDLGSQEIAHMSVKVYLFLLGSTFVAFTGLRARSLLNLDRCVYVVSRQLQISKVGDYLIKVTPKGTRRLVPPRRGQYVYIKLGYISEDHPFSVTQYNKTTGEITLAYRTAGMYTKELAKLSVGQGTYLSGPYGSFTADLGENDTTPVVYLAGGIGITPFVDRILSEGDTREQWLFAANRSRDTAVLVPQLKKQLAERCISIYSTEQYELQKGEELGYVTADLLRKYLGEPAKYRYYLCGPVPMMAASRRVLSELGIPASAIRSEKFGW